MRIEIDAQHARPAPAQPAGDGIAEAPEAQDDEVIRLRRRAALCVAGPPRTLKRREEPLEYRVKPRGISDER